MNKKNKKISRNIGEMVASLELSKNYKGEDALRGLIDYITDSTQVLKDDFIAGYKTIKSEGYELHWKSYIENIVKPEDILPVGTVVKLKGTNEVLGCIVDNDLENSLRDRSNLNYYVGDINENNKDIEMYLHHEVERLSFEELEKIMC